MLAKIKTVQKAVAAFVAAPIAGTLYALFTDADFSTANGVKAFALGVVSALFVYLAPKNKEGK